MHVHRQGEQGAIPVRSGRLFKIDNHWYFACRGLDKGPYDSRDEAEAALSLYIRNMNTRDQRRYR